MTVTCSISRDMVEEVRRVSLEEEFDRQVDVLISSGTHRFIEPLAMGESAFRGMLNQLKDLLGSVGPALADGYPRVLIVVPSGLVSLACQCHRISWDGRYVAMGMQENDLSVVSNGRPHCLPYLSAQIDMGCDYRPLSAEEYAAYIDERDQSPFYAEELLSLLRCKPKIMLERKVFCANMRHRPDNRAVYLERGEDNFELKVGDMDIVDQRHLFPSCKQRFYTGRPTGGLNTYD